MRISICAAAGIVGSIVATFFGGWSDGLTTLVIFMIIDYISGFVVAGVFKKSRKTESGALESRAGWKGLCRKCMTLVLVLVAYRLDLLRGEGTLIRDAVTIGFTINEGLSILENAVLMGLKVPEPLRKALEVLAPKAEVKEE